MQKLVQGLPLHWESGGQPLSIFPLPPSANVYWRVWRGRVVVSDEARAYKTTLAMLAKCDGAKPLTGPVAVTVRVFRERKGDRDNRLKVLLAKKTGVNPLSLDMGI